MVTDRRANSGALFLGFGLLLGACTTSSIRSDLADVRRLSGGRALASVVEPPVDSITSEDVRRLLAAPLDAGTAVRIALLNNRELRATLRELGVARGDLVQAGLLPNPLVDAEVLPERNTKVTLRLAYNLTETILAPMRARAAEEELEAAITHAAELTVDLALRARVAYHAIASAEQRLGTAQQTLDALFAAREAARALFEAGNVAEIEAVAEEAAYERARIAVAELELEVARDREVMNRLLGLHGNDTRWTIAGALDAVPEDLDVPADLEVRALEANLDLESARHELEAIARRLGVERVQGWLPDLTGDVHALFGNPLPDPAVTNNSPVSFAGGVSLSVPLFDRRQGVRHALTAEFDAGLERYYGLAIDVRSAAREVRNRVASAHARARHFEVRILPAQARLIQHTMLQYNAMQVGVFQVLEAKRAELDAKLGYIETLEDYWNAVAELEALLAGHHVVDSTEDRRTGAMARGGR